MKVYKIKMMGADLYVKGIMFDTSKGKVELQIIPAFLDEEAGWYEEDKAKKYCEELNKQNEEVQFILEEVVLNEGENVKKYINPNILNEGNQMEILKENDNEMETIVRCNNCGQPTKYGMTRMCSGYVGCDNKIMVHGKEVECYFGDLMPRIMDWKENHYELYQTRKPYRWRDGVDGGIDDR